jgi:hypothetical protein
MSGQKKSYPTSLQEQLVQALIQMQKTPGMRNVLQSCVNALKDKSRTTVPEGDYKNISSFKDLIFNLHSTKINKNIENANQLIELSQRVETKTLTSKK